MRSCTITCSNSKQKNLDIDFANDGYAKEISALINEAYRGSKGWTTESALVDGVRCTVGQVTEQINRPNLKYLVARQNACIVACIAVESADSYATIGSFAVTPALQNAGVGKIMLAHAEKVAQADFNARIIKMDVLSNREALISYYERKGYRRSGKLKEYPMHLDVGRPKDPNQMISELVKVL